MADITASKITPHLWFNDQAEAAAKLYTSIFADSHIDHVQRYSTDGSIDNGSDPLTVTFTVAGQQVIALNAGPHFKLDEAFSFYVDCADQAEVDRYWDALTADGGEESQCGWLKDRFGVSWQIVPRRLTELTTDPDPEKAARAMQAMFKMQKIDVAEIEAAAAG